MDYSSDLSAQSPNIPNYPVPANKTNRTLVFIIVILLLIIVGGGGFILAKYLYSPKPVSDIATQQPINQPAANSFSNLNTEKVATTPATVDETANWKTYVSEELGFSMKLPPTWRRYEHRNVKYKTGPGVIEDFTPLSDERFSQFLKNDPYNPTYYFEISVEDAVGGISLKEWADNADYSPQGAHQILTETMLNNNPAIKVVGNQGAGFVDYFLSHNGKIYNLGYYYLDDDQLWKRPPEITEVLFKQIISTFKFL